MDETDAAEIEQQLADESAYHYHALIVAEPLDPARGWPEGWVERRVKIARAPADLSLPGPVREAYTTVAVSPRWLQNTPEPDEGDGSDTVERLGRLAQQVLWEDHGYAVCGEWRGGMAISARVTPVEDR